MPNTGKKIYQFLKQINVTTGLPTGVRKPNTIGDPDYVQPVIDYIKCPITTWEGADASCIKVKTCPEGYTLSPDGLTCTKIETANPVVQDTPIHAAISQNVAYSSNGMKIYNPGYSITGDGANTLTTLNAYWINPSNTSLILGPMNRNGIWVDNNGDGIVDPLQAGKKLEVSFNFISAIQKTYFIGIGGDNKFKITINGIVIVDRTDIISDNFRYWNVYPVVLNAGYNLISFAGEGDGSVSDCLAAEIYENTQAQITAATQDSDLTLRFRTRDLRGGVLQLTQCPPGYQSITVGGAVVCQKVSQVGSLLLNTGQKAFTNRRRLLGGVADGYTEPNANPGGIGPYIPPVTDLTSCPI